MQNHVHEKLSACLRIFTKQANPWFLLWWQTPPLVLVFPPVNFEDWKTPLLKSKQTCMEIFTFLKNEGEDLLWCLWYMICETFFSIRRGIFLFARKQSYSLCIQRKSHHKAWFLWLKCYHITWFRFKRAELPKDFLRKASPDIELFMQFLPFYSLW